MSFKFIQSETSVFYRATAVPAVLGGQGGGAEGLLQHNQHEGRPRGRGTVA